MTAKNPTCMTSWLGTVIVSDLKSLPAFSRALMKFGIGVYVGHDALTNSAVGSWKSPILKMYDALRRSGAIG